MSRSPANNELPGGVNEPVDEESEDEESDDDRRPLFIEYFGALRTSSPRIAGVDVPFVPTVRDAFARRGHFDFDPYVLQALSCVLTFFCRSDATQEEAEAAVDRFLAMFPGINVDSFNVDSGGGR